MSAPSTSSTPTAPSTGGPVTGPRTVIARPMTFEDVTAIATGQTPLKFDAFKATPIGTLTPVKVTATPDKTRATRDQEIPFRLIPTAVENTGRNAENKPYLPDEENPAGYKVAIDVLDHFGSHTGGPLYTSAEAEKSAWLLQGIREPGETRGEIWLADPAGEEQPLTPVFGSQVTVSAIVAGVDPDVLAARVEAILAEEFGDALGTRAKILSRPVEDRRVAVFDSVTNRPIAVGILHAEVSSVMSRGHGAVRVEDMPDGLIVGDQA